MKAVAVRVSTTLNHEGVNMIVYHLFLAEEMAKVGKNNPNDQAVDLILV